MGFENVDIDHLKTLFILTLDSDSPRLTHLSTMKAFQIKYHAHPREHKVYTSTTTQR
jgi:hypothetical protein